MGNDGRDESMMVSHWRETVLEAEAIRVTVEYTGREWGVDNWKVTVSGDWEGSLLSKTDLVEIAILSLLQARVKLFVEAVERRWELVKNRLTGRFSR